MPTVPAPFLVRNMGCEGYISKLIYLAVEDMSQHGIFSGAHMPDGGGEGGIDCIGYVINLLLISYRFCPHDVYNSRSIREHWV